MNVMIDIETLGTTPGSVILSIGAVTFDRDVIGATFYRAIDADSCVKNGLTIDPKTVKWWMGQSDAARAAAFGEFAYPLGDALNAFFDWLFMVDAVRVWCHGATFDVPLIDAAARACNRETPWKFYEVRCTRTLYELAGVEVDRSTGTHHNPVDDAINQARAAIKAFEILKM